MLLILVRVLQHSEDKREFAKGLTNRVVEKVLGFCRDLENFFFIQASPYGAACRNLLGCTN